MKILLVSIKWARRPYYTLLLSTTLPSLVFLRVIRQQPFYLNTEMTFEKL